MRTSHEGGVSAIAKRNINYAAHHRTRLFSDFDGIALPKQSTRSTPVNLPATQKESEHIVHALRVTGYVRRVFQNTFNIPFRMILSVTEFSQLGFL